MANEYKVEQLREMLATEQGKYGADQAGHGAHLNHWYGKSSPIQLDAGAIQALIDYYEGQVAERPMALIRVYGGMVQSVHATNADLLVIVYDEDAEKEDWSQDTPEDERPMSGEEFDEMRKGLNAVW